jgi:hypothetical protein
MKTTLARLRKIISVDDNALFVKRRQAFKSPPAENIRCVHLLSVPPDENEPKRLTRNQILVGTAHKDQCGYTHSLTANGKLCASCKHIGKVIDLMPIEFVFAEFGCHSGLVALTLVNKTLYLEMTELEGNLQHRHVTDLGLQIKEGEVPRLSVWFPEEEDEPKLSVFRFTSKDQTTGTVPGFNIGDEPFFGLTIDWPETLRACACHVKIV